ncbi:A/G-specific adenine glycosylase [Actinomycetota bacterium]
MTLSPDPTVLHTTLLEWYAANARDLPWRGECSPWGVFLSEVMSHQTPVARVEPIWREWLERWPTPTHLADDSPGEAVRAWGRLGYPRRALRLHEAATVMRNDFDGAVPHIEAELLALPGVGPYTAAAVAAFAYGLRTTVVDTNIRRVLARAVEGKALAAPAVTRAEVDLAASLVPDDPATSVVWNVAVMELGALVCTARLPRCGDCPLLDQCAWVAAGQPAYAGPARRSQAWHGTDRQVRGAIVQLLRDAPGPVTRRALETAGEDPLQVDRCLDSLVADGLVEPLARNRFRLPA